MTASAEDATPRRPGRAARTFGGRLGDTWVFRRVAAARAAAGAMGLRARLMLLGVAGMSAGLALGGVTLVAVTGIALRNTVDTQARQTAEAVARLIDEQGQVPEAVPVIGVNGVNGLDVVVQVVDAQGRVRSASIGADRLTPLLHADELARVEPGEAMSVDGGRIGIEGPVRVVTARAGPPDDRLTVLVGKSISGTNASVRLLGTVVLVGFPLLVLILAVAGWRVIGAALRPVEALRQGAEEITGGARPGQLPVPVSKDEIHRLAVTLNGMLDRLEAARARQRSFVADAAHELRSPLTNMRAQLEVGRRLGERTDWPAVADDLLADTERLSRLVDDLLLLARADDPAATQAARSAAEPVELGQLA
ncbi:MAG TPA: histidine kinase dimerization/phospho-acceptor domain-containing protein, partial [Pilimelia sp.]|nr:histidine kinase dimerization/phospho-acceptor domain-containing protein [Pilimelia sp.]